ncbi:MAG: IS701 family transposase [Thermaceae bacterium]|nr:IS701 family transposase [Thermaceae bacterium]
MKPPQHTIPSSLVTTLADVIRWRGFLVQLHARLASYFARPQPYQRLLRFLQGIVSQVARKNGWQLAEQARETTPYGMQRLLSQAVWDGDGVRDEVRAFALEHLGTSEAIVAIDETSFPKRGKHSAGVKKQYCGTTGQVQNCQVGVFLSYITARGHTLIDRELYLPQDWTDDRERCRQAGIPDTIPFRTKPDLAIQMLERLHQAHVPLDWIVADSVYGGHLELRTWLETHQYSYVGAVACDEPVVLQTPLGVRRVEVRDVPALVLTDSSWHRLAMSEGTKGPRLCDWACVPLLHRGADDGWHSLLIRRTIDATPHQAYYLVFAPPATPLLAKVTALGGRWRIEEDFASGKDLGLDHYEVRSWTGWYRHITLVMLALAFLVAICVQEQRTALPNADGLAHPEAGAAPQDLLPLSVSEARHLLAHLLFPLPSSVTLVLAWSAWRRWHQRLACFFHTRRRVKAG